MSTEEPRNAQKYRITYLNDSTEELEADNLSIGEGQAVFYGYLANGRWAALLTLAASEYRSIRLLVDDEPAPASAIPGPGGWPISTD